MAYVALASRLYGAGRILIHTDRISSAQTGHSNNPSSFWRSVLEWTSQKQNYDNINVCLIINTQNESADKIHSLNPIDVTKKKFSDLAIISLSAYDLIYFVGLPDLVNSNIANRIEEYVDNGGGIIIETPDRGAEYINILSDIENIYVESAQKPTNNFAYWTNDGINSSFYNKDIVMSFMTSINLSAFSTEWTILMSSVANITTTTTSTSTENPIFDFDKRAESKFSVSFISTMKNGVIIIEPE